ncbi:MAG: hypothetical protein LAP38_03275 [Acidobacteriia bacterium]|nr:hypothetical protein [Terriglobia bacterium]
MNFEPGHKKIGGRAKGTPNKLTREAIEILERLGCNPIEGMARIAQGDVPCRVCRGKGKTLYQPARGKELAERTCESCYGRGLEIITPELSGKMYAELAQYIFPKRKAIEHTVTETGPDFNKMTPKQHAAYDHAEEILRAAGVKLS